MFGEALVVQHLSFATSELVSDLLFFALLCRFPPLLCFCFKSALATAALLSALIPQSPSLPLNSLAFGQFSPLICSHLYKSDIKNALIIRYLAWLGEGSIDCPWIETRPLKESESGETLSAATYEEKKANKEVSKYDEKKAKKEGEFKWDYDYKSLMLKRL
ncbi:hypothetical protein Ahy_B06g083485 isoform B [Arachis hypogaea]|uniref:Uncharacterized protein n=1 Tax=Arachis hypogaea TaxID=3818 RepID=A0A444YQ43_ARAHY|nr:hypothetical protein Ahy_B06g083485 isoform B [Arachis hypogaea]